MATVRATVVAVAAAWALAACGGKSEEELMASAKQHLAQHESKAAVIELKNLLDKNPQSAEGRYLLGKTLLDSGDAAGAEVEIQRAADLKWPKQELMPLRAQLLLAQGKPQRVVDNYGRMELHDAALGAPLYTLVATAYSMLNQPAEALAASEQALQLSPAHGPAVAAKARALVAQGRLDDALQLLDAHLQKASGDGENWQLKADLLLRAKADTEGAIAAYRKAIAADKDRGEAYGGLVRVYLERNELEAAERELAPLKRLQPQAAETHFLEARLAFARGDAKLARERLQPLLSALPNNVMVLQLAAGVEQQQGNAAAAADYLARAVQLAPGFGNARRLLAQAQLKLNQPAKALQTLAPLLEGASPDPVGLALAGQAQAQQGDEAAAKALFARAAKLKPDDKRLQAAVALTQYGSADTEAMSRQLQSLAADDKGSAIDMSLIGALLQRGDYERALAAVGQLEAKQPGSLEPLLLRGRVQALRKQDDAARATFEQVLKKDPKYLPAVLALAGLDLRHGQPEAARARVEGYVKVDPKNVTAQLALADLLQRIGASPAEIGRVYKDAVLAAPNEARTRVAQLDHLLAQADREAALTTAQAAAAALPNDPQVLERLAQAQLLNADRAQAAATFRKLVADPRAAERGHLGLARLAVAGGDDAGAQRELNQVLEANPDSLPAQQLLFGLLMRGGKTQDALALARAAQARQPTQAAGFLAEGDVLVAQQQWDPALAAYRKAAALAGGEEAPARVHATLLAARRTAQAQQYADAWAAEHPQDLAFQTYLADAALNRGELPLAEQRYLALLKKVPEHPVALNNVAWVLMKQNKPGALPYAERAARAAPGNPSVLDTLAQAQAGAKQLDQAIATQQRAVERAPDAAVFRLNLAKLYLQAGDKAHAGAQLEQVNKMSTTPLEQVQAQQLRKTAGL